MRDTTKWDAWIKWLIIASCVVFILVLALSAVFDPFIRVLHAFQALIYVAVIIQAVRRSAWGYGAGCLIAAFWNWINRVHTTFIANALRELSRVFRSGQSIVNGKVIERKAPRPPGMIFFNQLGDEMGGLIFGDNGGKGHFGMFTFDKVQNNQTMAWSEARAFIVFDRCESDKNEKPRR